MGVVNMNLNELWVYIGELINQAIAWVGVNWEAVVATVASVGGVSGVIVIAVNIVKTVVPLLKNSNTPVLKMLGDFISAQTPKMDSLVLKITALESKVDTLETENRTLKDYIALSAETNAKSVFLDAETKARYATFALALKSVPNTTVQQIGAEVEKAIGDGEITPTEAVEIASKLPIVEKALGTPISDIVPKGV